MRHNIHLSLNGCFLRPVTEADSGFIVKLRNSKHVCGKMGTSATSEIEQNRWLRKYYYDTTDYYFIVENSYHRSIGTISVYNIDEKNKIAETGRLAFVEDYVGAGLLYSSMMLINFAFDKFMLNRLYGNVVANNKHVISLNKRLGYEVIKLIPNGQKIGENFVDSIHIALTITKWRLVYPKLVMLAQKLKCLEE